MEKLKNKENSKINIREDKEDSLVIFKMYHDTHFENFISEKVKPIILESEKINENLKNVVWVPIRSDSTHKHDILFMLFNDNINRNANDKIIFLWDEPTKTFERHLHKYFLEEQADYDFDEMFEIVKKIVNWWSRYLSYRDINNKWIIKGLYTANDYFRNFRLDKSEQWLRENALLQNVIKSYVKKLSKFSEFSFEYQYDEKSNTELNRIIKDMFDGFNREFHGFFYGLDEVIPFLKYQMHRLIDKKTKEQIENEMFNMPFLFDENSNDNFIKDCPMQNGDKLTNKIGYIIDDTTFGIASVLLQPTPPLEYDWLSDTDKNKLKQIKNRFPDYFFSEKDVLYYLEWLISKVKISPDTTWIFCDIDGTLVTDGHINPKVIQKLIDYYNVWKRIQLWTAWNIYNKVELLDSLLPEFLGLWLDLEKLRNMWFIDISPDWDRYFRCINNKYDYQWLTPEIVLDDWPVKRFNYLLDIKPQHFINVNSL